MLSHDEADRILRRAVPGITDAESALVRTIAVLESQYGAGWSGAGVGSHNWGAIQAGGTWTGDTFEAKDSRWDPKTGKQETYVTTFRKYATDEDGARDLWSVLSSPRHRRAVSLANRGAWAEISRSLGPLGSGYYEGFGPPEKATADHQMKFLKVLHDIRGLSNWSGWPVLLIVIAVAAALGGKWRTF
jgi:hypothetical protein